MPRSALLFLSDIRHSCEYLSHRTVDMSLDEYLEDQDVRFIAERIFTIIGEAMANPRRDFPAIGERFDEEASVIAFRNFVIHHYWSLDHKEVWSIIQSKLRPLNEAVSKLMLDLERGA